MSQAEANNLSQKEIDEREWSNPKNWHWSFYYSKKDSRTFVPRRWYGQTLNLARPAALWFCLFLMFMPLLIIGGILISRAF